MDVQTTLSTPNVLYNDDAAKVVHQVFTLRPNSRRSSAIKRKKIAELPTNDQVSEDQRAVEDQQDRHQWIVRELEQLQNIDGNLQEVIDFYNGINRRMLTLCDD
ncbi:hypothetical protein VTP01DRAFT_2387 [Rhizomucor pusillus]|uniref:uncharacterized protein n=1 Tax=Rhizomucor pusillus TaxID=4840 RepID=UPI0037445781